MEATREFINYLHRGGSYGYYWLKYPSGLKKTIWFEAGKPPDFPAGSYELYFGVNPTKYIPKHIKEGQEVKPENARAYLEDIDCVNCLFAEFDAKDFPGGKEGAWKHIDKNDYYFYPSVVIDSGGGYHAYWLLYDPIPIDNLAGLEKLRNIQARWVDFVTGDPGAKDLARVLRVPGTYNFKYESPREVKILFADYDALYELPEFLRILPPEAPPTAAPAPKILIGNNKDFEWALTVAVSRAREGTRHNTAFWLACQLRDNGAPMNVAESIIQEYVNRVAGGKKPYTIEEGLVNLKNAYKSPAREPSNRGNRVMAR
jgi:hypothetical protein